MAIIHPYSDDFADYVHDESRSQGVAESISFPESETEVCEILRMLFPAGTHVTVQGARTGLAAGAVPHGGHVMNLSHMNRYLGMRQDGNHFFLRVQPGVVLSELRKHLKALDFVTEDWSKSAAAALEALRGSSAYIFPTDPTETSACLGGMAACNASGARSFYYGSMRRHVSALRVVLSDGDVLVLKRGEVFSRGRTLTLMTEGGRTLNVALPTYTMPAAKNASGYFVADNMDALDLFIGSDGTLGVITELELELMPAPAITWGVSCFFTAESQALDFTCAVRDVLDVGAEKPVALEYFDGDALDILRAQKTAGSTFAALREPPKDARCCVYVELAGASTDSVLATLRCLGEIMQRVGGDSAKTWVARTEIDRDALQFFRHAVPESVNMLIDKRRRTSSGITKLGSDMSVPNEWLREVVALYRKTLSEEHLQSAAWGHIGNNHLHVNILPHNLDEYHRGKELFARWAAEITRMGGAVSAEHGVGKLKRDFLAIMYGPRHIEEMARLKLTFDPKAQLGRGNLFDENIVDCLQKEGA